MHIASKLRLNFNITTLTFADIYPEEELSSVMTKEEFNTIMHRINVEMAHDLHENSKAIRRWFKIVGISSIFIFGILLLPVLLHKSGRQAKLLTQFQENVKEYLYRLNKKKYLKRRIEWKLIKDTPHATSTSVADTFALDSRTRNRHSRADAINPATQLRLELIYESDASRMLNQRITILRTRNQGISNGSTTSFTGMTTPTPPTSELENYSEMTLSPSHQSPMIKNMESSQNELKSHAQDQNIPTELPSKPIDPLSKDHYDKVIESQIKKSLLQSSGTYGQNHKHDKDENEPTFILLDKHQILKEVLVSSRHRHRTSSSI